MGTRKAISRSMTVYNKHLSSQCKLTAQTVQVHYLRLGEHQFLWIINPYINLLKSLIVNYIRKISNIKPYVPLLDLSVIIDWLSLQVLFRVNKISITSS